MITQCQALQTAGQSYIVHSLVQQAARQCCIIHALIEIITKGQAMRTAGQSYHVCNFHGASMLLLKRLPKVKLVKLSHQSFYYLAVVAKATAPFDVYCLAFGSSLAKRGMCSCLSRQLLIIYPNMR